MTPRERRLQILKEREIEKQKSAIVALMNQAGRIEVEGFVTEIEAKISPVSVFSLSIRSDANYTARILTESSRGKLRNWFRGLIGECDDGEVCIAFLEFSEVPWFRFEITSSEDLSDVWETSEYKELAFLFPSSKRGLSIVTDDDSLWYYGYSFEFEELNVASKIP